MTTPIKEISQKDGPVVMLNFDPPGTVLFEGLRVETDEKMIQFSCVFGLLSMLTIVIDKLVRVFFWSFLVSSKLLNRFE